MDSVGKRFQVAVAGKRVDGVAGVAARHADVFTTSLGQGRERVDCKDESVAKDGDFRT